MVLSRNAWIMTHMVRKSHEITIFFSQNTKLYFIIAEDTSINETLGNEEQFCTQPIEPANGHFICDMNNVIQGENNIQWFASGSICQVNCNPSYSIPLHLYEMSIIECRNGDWNLNEIEFCYKEQPKRRHAALRHRRRKKKRRINWN